MKRSRSPEQDEDPRNTKRRDTKSSETPTKNPKGIEISETNDMTTPEKIDASGVEKGSVPTSKRKALEGHKSLETPAMRKIAVKKLETPFQRKKQERPESAYFSPFTKRQANIESHIVQQYEKRQKMQCFPRVVCIEGNIGSGKSTLLRELEKTGYCVLQEPVNKTWYKFLPLLYSDPKRWGMTFQLEVLHWFHTLGEKILPELSKRHPRIIVERSPMSAFFIFCSNLYAEGNMNDWEYDKMKWVFGTVNWKPRKTLYLQASPEICCERIRQRNRTGEEEIDHELIENLHRRHERCLTEVHDEDVEVVVIDAGRNIEQVTEDALKALRKHIPGKPSARKIRPKHAQVDIPISRRVRVDVAPRQQTKIVESPMTICT